MDEELVGLVAAISPELTGRVHLAYQRVTDGRWWRQRYPGLAAIPEWDYVSLCGRHGLVPPSPPRDADCLSCQRILAARGPQWTDALSSVSIRAHANATSRHRSR